MASLARIRLAKRLPRTFLPQQVRSADTTELYEKPSDLLQSITLKLHEDSFRAYNCDKPDLEVQVTKNELLTMYKKMQTMRQMELAADALYKVKLIHGFCLLAIGQEAVSVGLEHGIKRDDPVIIPYRCHPFTVMCGGTIKGVLGELLGRQCGMSNGKGGSMHTPSFFGGNGIVGAQVPVGAGVAFAQKYRGEKHCTFALYGDGASNQGQVFESYNIFSSSHFDQQHVLMLDYSGQTLESSTLLSPYPLTSTTPSTRPLKETSWDNPPSQRAPNYQ